MTVKYVKHQIVVNAHLVKIKLNLVELVKGDKGAIAKSMVFIALSYLEFVVLATLVSLYNYIRDTLHLTRAQQIL